MTNETGNVAGSCAVSVRLDATAFRCWRKAHQFRSPELSIWTAEVERDLELLPQLGPHNTESRAVIMKNLAAFADAMAAQ